MFFCRNFSSLWHEVTSEEEKQIFLPSIKVLNAKQMKKENVRYKWFNFPHHIELKEALQIEMFCSFDFSTFPFDSHTCDLHIGSFSVSEYYVKLIPMNIFHKGYTY